jgi:ACR3 family arsenite efflux pump ArsB
MTDKVWSLSIIFFTPMYLIVPGFIRIWAITKNIFLAFGIPLALGIITGVLIWHSDKEVRTDITIENYNSIFGSTGR